MGILSRIRLRLDSKPPPLPIDPVEASQAARRRGAAALAEGRASSAVEAFREALAHDRSLAINHVNLAYALQQTDSRDEVLPLLQRALVLDPASFDAEYMLAGEHEREPDLEAAEGHLRAALKLRPDFEPARIDLCRILAAGGDRAAAREAITSAITMNPSNADFHYYLGNVCMADADTSGAIASYRHALALHPGHVPVHINLGLAHHARKEYDDAARSFEAAVALDRTSRDGHANLGMTRKAQGRLADATAALQQALALKPTDADVLNELGGVYLDQGLLQQAMDSYGRAIALRPDEPGGYGNLGLALYEAGDLAKAVTTYREGLKRASVANIHDNLAIALLRQGLAHEAVEHFRLAVASKPDDINTRTNLAAALTEAEGPKAGIQAYRDILERHPDQLAAHSNLLFNLTYDESCSPQDYLLEARRFNAKLERKALQAVRLPRSALEKKLKIGLVSGDFHQHPVGYFLEGVLRHLDPAKFELFAYPSTAKFDALSARIQSRFKAWRLIKGLPDPVAAQTIRDDGIDILLDLSGHTGDNRLPMFALRPAAVQATWLGYFASTGVDEIDYILADPASVPEGHERQFSEKVWRLPETRLCYTPPFGDAAPPVAPLPALTRGHVTFGCFQRFQKIGDAVLAAWGDVFRAIPDARLLLQCQQCVNPLFVAGMQSRLGSVGIAPNRIWTRPAAPHSAYLSSYGDVDIALDTFPYNGGTTTCEAAWMGVPTLTIAGNSMLSLQGAAMMGAVGLSDWVASSPDDLVRRAAAFAGDIEALSHLRQGLREQVRASPLFDTELFARRLEASLLGMWHAPSD